VWNFDDDLRFGDEELYNFIQNYVNKGYSVYVGTDSQAVQNKYVFATAICLHHPVKRDGVCYFWRKVKFPRTKFNNLQERLLKEATLTLLVAQKLKENINNVDLEVHFDVSSDEKYASSRSMSLITSYALGFGFKYQVKPFSWAASGAADGHCKR
tara:strand:+ start:3058 stop:3522 length:465 start_codon:yes stop_codon:yes gene_type:complete